MDQTFFWTKICIAQIFGPKDLLTKISTSNKSFYLFWTKFFWSNMLKIPTQNILSRKFHLDQNFFITISWTSKFIWPNFLGPILFFIPDVFFRRNLNIFDTDFLDRALYWGGKVKFGFLPQKFAYLSLTETFYQFQMNTHQALLIFTLQSHLSLLGLNPSSAQHIVSRVGGWMDGLKLRLLNVSWKKNDY